MKFFILFGSITGWEGQVYISHEFLVHRFLWRSIVINPYWQIMENSSRNFPEIFIFRVVTRAVSLENSSIQIF